MTKQKVIMVHGWGGNNEDGWFLPLKEELEKEKMIVINPNMPDSPNPKINSWINELKKVSGNIEKNTYFIGHSIGCQTIIRFLEKSDNKIGGAILIAAWFNLTDETWNEKYTREIAKPWIETPIDFNKVKNNCKRILVILSKDDPYVLVNNADIFKKELNAKIVLIENRGHIEQLNKKEINKIVEFIKNDNSK
jgi:predicted alpha/beta hydrolase family esterase